MKQGWGIKKLGEIARIINGYAFDSKLFSTNDNDMPLIRIRDIKRGYTETFYKGKYSDSYIVKNGDYIIGMDGEFNITEWNGGDALLNQRVCKIEFIDDTIIGRYVLRFLSIELKRIEDATSFVTVKHLSSKILYSIPIPVPPREEQERIVGELDCLSGIIENKRAQLRELDALAQSIFYTMFGDPITNDKGWETKKLGEICEIINGFAFKSNLFTKVGDVIVRISNIKDGYVDLSDAVCFNKNDYKKINFDKYMVYPSDIVIALSGATTGKLGINNSGKKLYLNQRVAICRENITALSKLYLLYYLHAQSVKFMNDAEGVAQPNLSTEQMKQYIIGIPPIELQQQFAEKIENIERQKELIKQSIKEAEDLFNSRMDYYFN